MQPKIFAGSANAPLAQALVDCLGLKMGRVTLGSHPDGETKVQFMESVRGHDVFIVQPICSPVNKNLMELLIMLDALKRSSPSRITAVIPYYAYSRQDRKHGPREPISAKLVADLISVAGSQRVLLLDLHSIQIQGFFNIPADDLSSEQLFMDYFWLKRFPPGRVTIVAANADATRRAKNLAKQTNACLAVIESRVVDDRRVLNVVGSVRPICIAIDNMIDTGCRAIQAAKVLKGSGAEQVFLWATHAVLSCDVQTLQDSQLDEIVLTDSIPIPPAKRFPKLHICSIASLLAQAVRRVHGEQSISELSSVCPQKGESSHVDHDTL